jgi:glutamyl-tRNA reductase
MLTSCVSAGNRVRAETGISRGAVSISSAAVEFTNMKLNGNKAKTGFSKSRVLVIGAGKMSRLLLINLQAQGVKSVTVVNRSPESVKKLQEEMAGMDVVYRPLTEMWEAIAEADIVYPCTGSSSTIIDPASLKKALVRRQEIMNKQGDTTTTPQPLRFVDISVPRNVHADCSSVAGAECYNVDHLKEVVDRNTFRRKKEVLKVESILRDVMEKHAAWQQSLGAIPTILKLQEKAESLRVEELQKMSNELKKLSPDELATVNNLSRGIVKRLLQGPMTHLRRQKALDTTKVAISQLQEAFQLK